MLHNFEEQLAFGKIGESYIANWLRMSCRYHVLPVYEKVVDDHKGPVFVEQGGDQLIAPDILAFRIQNGNKIHMRWVEAKTKSAFTWHRISKRWTTGIDLHHYEQYMQIANLSAWPVWLLFLHYKGQAKDSPIGSPTGLFGGELIYLSQNENHRHQNWGKSGMVYWAHEKLQQLATLEQVYNATAHSRKIMALKQSQKAA